jgi:hypothetical protein
MFTGRSQWPRGLRRGSSAALAYWDCGFELFEINLIIFCTYFLLFLPFSSNCAVSVYLCTVAVACSLSNRSSSSSSGSGSGSASDSLF